MAPLYTTPLARHGFNGADTDDIDGSTLDGDGTPALAVGVLTRVSLPFDTLGIRSSNGVALNGSIPTDVARYVVGSIPSLPSVYRVEDIGRYPAAHEGEDDCASQTQTLITSDDGSGADTSDISGQSLTGGPGTWDRPLESGSPSNDPVRRSGGVFTGSGGSNEVAAVITGLGIGRDYGVRVTGRFLAYLNSTNDVPNAFSALARFQLDKTVDITGITGLGLTLTQQVASADYLLQLSLGVDGIQQFANVGALSLDTDYTIEIIVSGRGHVCAKLIDVAGFTTEVTWDRSRSPGEECPGFGIATEPQAGADNTPLDPMGCTVSLVEVFTVSGTPGGLSNEYGVKEVSVRASDDGLNSYRWRQEFDHFDVDPEIFYYLEAVIAGTVIGLRYPDVIPALHDTDYPFSLAVDETGKLHAYDGDTEVVTFDPATDLADDTSATVDVLPDALPGLGGLDLGGASWFMLNLQWTVYVAQEFPCTGDPGGPNPYPDPPPTEPLPVYVYLREMAAWRAVLAPVPGVQPGEVYQRAMGATRHGSDMAIMAMGDWRHPSPEIGDQGPPPNDPLPPFFDPCGILPPTPFPDDVPLIPFTSRRFFGQANAPMSVCGPLFNGTVIALGRWTPGDISVGTSKQVVLVTGQGGYGFYTINNQWVKSKFIDETLARVTPVLSALQAGTATGWYFGHQCIDDMLVKNFWGPNGVPEDELADALSIIRGYCPGIRFGNRIRPTQVRGGNMGFDFYGIQYASQLGNPFTFGAVEYARALSWGAYSMLNLNYVHGGNGDSGVRFFNNTFLSGRFMCSASEVVNYLTNMWNGALSIDGTAGKMVGSAGYTYWPGNNLNPPFLSLPGMPQAMATARNALAALPPLT